MHILPYLNVLHRGIAVVFDIACSHHLQSFKYSTTPTLYLYSLQVQDLRYILICMAMTEERLDRLGHHQQCSRRQYAAVVPESISCFRLEARRIDRYVGPTLSDIAQMSDIRLRSLMYRRICRGLGAPAASQSLIANTTPP